jgi:prolycopene isomerase
LACKRSILAAVKTPYPTDTAALTTEAPTDVVYDAVIIGGGMGGLTTAAKLVAKGAKVVVLEKYLVPGGSAAHYKREGYTFDVGSSMMFGFGDQGTTNLITKALESVGKRMKTVPDPTQVHYHCPPSSAHPEVGLLCCLRRHAAAAAAAMCACVLQEVLLMHMLPATGG